MALRSSPVTADGLRYDLRATAIHEHATAAASRVVSPTNDDELDRNYDADPLALHGREQTGDPPRHDEAVVSNIFEKAAVVYLTDYIDIVVAPDLERSLWRPI